MTDTESWRHLRQIKGWLIKTCGDFCGDFCEGYLLGLIIGSPIIVAFIIWGPPKGAC